MSAASDGRHRAAAVLTRLMDLSSRFTILTATSTSMRGQNARYTCIDTSGTLMQR